MFVRSSKFRHVFGNPWRKEQCYEGIRVTKSAHDSNFCAVNPKFLAVVLESAGGGAFLVLPLEKTGRIDFNVPKVCGHRGPVTDVKWNPFDDHVIASASDDTMIKIWEIPVGGLTETLSSCATDLQGHSKRVNYIEWHPTAADILLSAGADFQCVLWNVSSGAAVRQISVHSDVIFSISWNRTGNLFATTSKDKLIRVIDARNGNVVAKGEGHLGSKASKVVFLGAKNLLFTTGYSRMSERQYAMWNMTQMSKPLKIEEIDASSGLLMPFYDHDTGVVYLAGKGDGNIRYMEVVDSPPYTHFLSQYQSSTPQRGLGVLPKRGMDVSRCEIFRFYKLHSLKDFCEPISMIVPRKSEVFQADLYPDTVGTQPALSADEWLSGQNREPVLVSLKDGNLQMKDDKSFVSRSLSLREVSGSGFSRRNEDILLDNRIRNSHRELTAASSSLSFAAAQTALESEGKPSNADDANSSRSSAMQSGASSTMTASRAIVQRAATFHGVGAGRGAPYALSPGGAPTTAASTNQLHLLRGAPARTDLSHLPTVTSQPQQKVVRRHRRRRRNEDSSSCSSMEDLDTMGSAWTDNPLYSQGKSPPGARRKNGRGLHHRRAPPPVQSNVDLGPLNEVLNGSEFRSPMRPLSKSSVDLNYRPVAAESAPKSIGGQSGFVPVQPTTNRELVSKSSGDLISFDESGSDGEILKRFPESSANVRLTSATEGILHPKAQFRSEPDVGANSWGVLGASDRHRASFGPSTAAPLARAEDDRIFEDDLSLDGSRAMIDCISMEAPDDTVIKPSRLRASMNSRHQRRRPDSSDVSSAASAMPLRRAGSLRETKSSFMAGSSVVGNALIPETPVESAPSAFQPVQRQQQRNSMEALTPVRSRVILPGTQSSALSPPRFVLPSSGKGSALPNPFVFTVPADCAKKQPSSAVEKTRSHATEQLMLVNGVADDNNDPDRQRLLDLCKRQSDEIQLLKQQLSDRDAKIRLMETLLRDQSTADPRHRTIGMAKSNV